MLRTQQINYTNFVQNTTLDTLKYLFARGLLPNFKPCHYIQALLDKKKLTAENFKVLEFMLALSKVELLEQENTPELVSENEKCLELMCMYVPLVKLFRCAIKSRKTVMINYIYKRLVERQDLLYLQHLIEFSDYVFTERLLQYFDTEELRRGVVKELMMKGATISIQLLMEQRYEEMAKIRNNFDTQILIELLVAGNIDCINSFTHIKN